jgi:hypothetical protein
VNRLLGLGQMRWLLPVLHLYKFSRLLNLHNLLKNTILPGEYKNSVRGLDHVAEI